VTNRLACSEGRAFDFNIAACNHEGLVNCVDPECPPTASPTEGPSGSPTDGPTEIPTGENSHVSCLLGDVCGGVLFWFLIYWMEWICH